MTTHTLTEQQETALKTAHKGGHTLYKGCPGGSKSFMQEKTYKQLSDEVRYKTEILCYSVAGRESIEERMGKSKNIRTFDSLSCVTYARFINANFKYWRPDRFRHRRFIALFASRFWPEDNGQYEPARLQAMDDLERVQTIAMATLFNKFGDPGEILSLAERWGVELAIPDFVTQGLLQIMKWTINGLDEPLDGSYYTLRDGYQFDDLPYLIATNPNIPVQAMKVLIPDELQDATMAQWVMLRRRLGGPAYTPGEDKNVKMEGQLIGALDPNQAIYAFRGVYNDMTGRIINSTGAEVCPLTQSFRLAKALLARPKKIVAELECYHANPQGAEVTIDMGDVLELAKPGHVYLSLTNVSCIRMAYFLIRNGKAAIVKGTEIGVDLIRLLDTLAKNQKFTYRDLGVILEEWKKAQAEFMRARYKNPEAKVEAMEERCASLEYLWEGGVSEGINTVEGLRERIRTIFADNVDAHGKAVVCMTYWKSKGLEFPVCFMEENDINSARSGHPNEVQQHRNALYVGLTRMMAIRYIIKDGKTIRNADRMG